MCAARASPRWWRRPRNTARCSAPAHGGRWRCTGTTTTTSMTTAAPMGMGMAMTMCMSMSMSMSTLTRPRDDAGRFSDSRHAGGSGRGAGGGAAWLFRGLAADGVFRRRHGACVDPWRGAGAGLRDIGVHRRAGGGAYHGGGGVEPVGARHGDGHPSGGDGPFGTGLRAGGGVVPSGRTDRPDGLSLWRYPGGGQGRSGSDLGWSGGGCGAAGMALAGAVDRDAEPRSCKGQRDRSAPRAIGADTGAGGGGGGGDQGGGRAADCRDADRAGRRGAPAGGHARADGADRGRAGGAGRPWRRAGVFRAGYPHGTDDRLCGCGDLCTDNGRDGPWASERKNLISKDESNPWEKFYPGADFLLTVFVGNR